MDFETAVGERIPILSILLNNFCMTIELKFMPISTQKMPALGPPMNARLREALVNPWLATLVSFARATALFVGVAGCILCPLPTAEGRRQNASRRFGRRRWSVCRSCWFALRQ
jgi:hypothetical protein